MSEPISLPSAPGGLLHWLPELSKQPYWHPEQMKHKPAPDGLRHEQWWPLVKCLRIARWKPVILPGLGTGQFGVVLSDEMLPVLHLFDTRVMRATPVQPAEVRERWQTRRMSAMMQEAVASVQLSGRAVSWEHSMDMLRQARQPIHSWDQLVWNLHRLLKALPEMSREALTTAGIRVAYQRLLERTGMAEGSMDEASLAAVCEFAEGPLSEGAGFLHPLIRAIITGWWLSRLDGLGDVGSILGRYVMHWTGMRSGYGVLAWTAPSRALMADPQDYLSASVRVESDEGDLTYVILPVLQALKTALTSAERTAHEAEAELLAGRHSWNRFGLLNARQEGLVLRAMDHPGEAFTIESHREAHDLAYATARADLLRMEQIGLMRKRQAGKGFVFEPAPDWRDKLMRLGEG